MGGGAVECSAESSGPAPTNGDALEVAGSLSAPSLILSAGPVNKKLNFINRTDLYCTIKELDSFESIFLPHILSHTIYRVRQQV